MNITRREAIQLAIAAPLYMQSPVNAPSSVVSTNKSAPPSVRLIRDWNGALCRSRLVNEGREPVQLKEVVLFDIHLTLPPVTRLYAEGFQMLSQNGGTIGEPADLGSYTDAKHYKMAAPPEGRVFYGLITLSPPQGPAQLMAFTSCRGSAGRCFCAGPSLEGVIDTEGRELAPGETWELEEFTFRSGVKREQLLAELAERLVQNHPPLRAKTPPTGWCSWYCFGPSVTAQQVLDNLDFIAKNAPGLKYVQIDDGYQPAMGDWLETGTAFGRNVQAVLQHIRARGFEPAIWVAPFIAEEKSHVFQQHPEWFVKGDDSKPLRSDKVTFGGWRRGPWYVLDGTHPEVQKHFRDLFGTMRREWGCTYFKLDANFWGAIHGGRFHDAKATRIEAYRRGMQAILRGASDSFILGCNHPIWPSLGVIHGSRSSNDIKRTWDRIVSTARQNLLRNWQNGRLWWNDPDAVVLTGDLPDDEFQFHATAIYASGGMLLSGDDLTKIPAPRLAMLKKLLPPTGIPAEFEDDSLRVGVVKLGNARMVTVFNWDDKPQTISFRLPESAAVTDYWTGNALGRHKGTFTISNMPGRSARLLRLA